MTLRVVQPGELLGELALLHPDEQHTGRARALELTETLALYRNDFEEVRLRHPGLAAACGVGCGLWRRSDPDGAG